MHVYNKIMKILSMSSIAHLKFLSKIMWYSSIKLWDNTINSLWYYKELLKITHHMLHHLRDMIEFLVRKYD